MLKIYYLIKNKFNRIKNIVDLLVMLIKMVLLYNFVIILKVLCRRGNFRLMGYRLGRIILDKLWKYMLVIVRNIILGLLLLHLIKEKIKKRSRTVKGKEHL